MLGKISRLEEWHKRRRRAGKREDREERELGAELGRALEAVSGWPDQKDYEPGCLGLCDCAVASIGALEDLHAALFAVSLFTRAPGATLWRPAFPRNSEAFGRRHAPAPWAVGTRYGIVLA